MIDKEFFKDTRPWKVESGSIYTEDGTPIAHMDRVIGNGTSPTERDQNAHLIVDAVNAYVIPEVKAWTPVYFYLTVVSTGDGNGRIEVQYKADAEGNEATKEIRGMKDYYEFFALRKAEAEAKGLTITVMCSSSMDFPDDYAGRAVADIARAIRKGEEVTA